MKDDSPPLPAHQSGEQSLLVARPPRGVDLDSFFGPVRVEWDQSLNHYELNPKQIEKKSRRGRPLLGARSALDCVSSSKDL
jgi:hypothetical protein